jgi:hypothetical protein
MSVLSHIRRFVVIAVVGCAILGCWSSAAAARPIDDPSLPSTRSAASTTEPRTVSASEGSDWTLPIMVAGAVVLVLAGTVGYSYRSHTSRRATA